MKKNILLLSLSVMLISCSERELSKPKGEFPITENMVADSIYLESANGVNVDFWQLQGDKLVLLNRADKSGALSVYSYPDFKLLYKYGVRGRADGEFISIMWANMNRPNSCGLYDIMNCKFYLYDLYADTLSKSATYCLLNAEEQRSEPYTQIVQMTENKFVYKCDLPDSTVLSVRNPQNNKVYFDFQSVLKRDADVVYTPYDFIVRTDGQDKICLLYNFIDRIEIYKTDDKSATPVAIIGNDKGQQDESEDVDSYVDYYTDAVIDKDHLYLLYQGGRVGERSSTIEIWDLEGNPIRKLSLDKYIFSMVVDPNNKTIYGYSPVNENNYIYKFQFND